MDGPQETSNTSRETSVYVQEYTPQGSQVPVIKKIGGGFFDQKTFAGVRNRGTVGPVVIKHHALPVSQSHDTAG